MLDSLIYQGLSNKVGDQTIGFKVTDNPKFEGVDLNRVTVIRVDQTEMNLFIDPIAYTRLSSKKKKVLRLSPEKISKLKVNNETK